MLSLDFMDYVNQYMALEEESFRDDSLFDSFPADDEESARVAARITAVQKGFMSAEEFDSIYNDYKKRKETGLKVYQAVTVEPPAKQETAKKQQKIPLTIERLADELQSQGYYIRMNVLSHDIEIQSVDESEEIDFSGMITKMHSFLRGEKSFYTGVTFENLSAYAVEIAKSRKYNPVLEYLDSVEYDGKNHFKELFELMGIMEDGLSESLVIKWFLQGIALLHNTEQKHIPAEGVLVLVGKQGCGKTSLIERFAIKPEWFVRGAAINSNDKDTYRRACSGWIIELGEVETTLKSDIDMLKNFITNDYDVYRVPYGRSDLKYARRSNLAATCNSDRYLIDQTGNRRWWTVPIDINIPYSDIQQLDIVQLWKQALDIYNTVGKDCFRLSPDEYDDLNERNSRALKPVKAEEEIADIFGAAQSHPTDYKFLNITITDWKNYHSSLKKYDTHTIGLALKKLGIEQKRIRTGARLYSLPVWKNASSLYDNEAC